MPVHAHHAAERRKPERITEMRQKSCLTVSKHNVLSDRGTKLRHALGESMRHTSTVERKIGNAGTPHNFYF
jgi:hypothetical protein